MSFGALINVKNPPFFCQRVCGAEDFSFDEWNKAFKYCEAMGLSENETNKILNPELFPCRIQCEACINIVLDTQRKTKELIINQNLKKHENNIIK